MTGAQHTRDEDCTVGEDGTCTGCGVAHGGDPCGICGARAFHRVGCAMGLRRAQAAHAAADVALRAALDPFKAGTYAEPEEWRAEQARLLALGETQRANACGWAAWDLETRRAIRSPLDVRWGSGPREITRYGERVVGPEAG